MDEYPDPRTADVDTVIHKAFLWLETEFDTLESVGIGAADLGLLTTAYVAYGGTVGGVVGAISGLVHAGSYLCWPAFGSGGRRVTQVRRLERYAAPTKPSLADDIQARMAGW